MKVANVNVKHNFLLYMQYSGINKTGGCVNTEGMTTKWHPHASNVYSISNHIWWCREDLFQSHADHSHKWPQLSLYVL